MSASANLASLTSVKRYLNISLSDTDNDDILNQLIGAASEAVETYCNRKFARTVYTEYHDGRGDARLVLDHRPVVSVTSVHDDLNRTFGADSLILSDDYIVRELAGIIELLRSAATFSSSSAFFSDGQRSVKVVYEAGYATIPEDVAHACIILTAALYHRGKQGADAVYSENQAGAYAVTYDANLFSPALRALLVRYREVRL